MLVKLNKNKHYYTRKAFLFARIKAIIRWKFITFFRVFCFPEQILFLCGEVLRLDRAPAVFYGPAPPAKDFGNLVANLL